MLVFIDTEFTSLDEPYLISAGLIVDDRELYFEVAGVSSEICSAFVQANVLPLLQGPKLKPLEIATLLNAFLNSDGHELTFFCDAPRYDVTLLLPFLPLNLHWRYAVPSFETDVFQQAFEKRLQNAFDTGLRRHHALDDARALAIAWKSV